MYQALNKFNFNTSFIAVVSCKCIHSASKVKSRLQNVPVIRPTTLAQREIRISVTIKQNLREKNRIKDASTATSIKIKALLPGVKVSGLSSAWNLNNPTRKIRYTPEHNVSFTHWLWKIWQTQQPLATYDKTVLPPRNCQKPALVDNATNKGRI